MSMKRTQFDVWMEMYRESHKDAPHTPSELTQMRWEELIRSRELKRTWQGNRRPKNQRHVRN